MGAVIDRTVDVLIAVNAVTNFVGEAVEAESMVGIAVLGNCIHVGGGLLDAAYLTV